MSIYRHIHFFSLIMPALMSLCACASDQSDEPDNKETNSCILFGIGNISNSLSWTPGVESRSGSDIIACMPEALGVFGYSEEEEVFSNVKIIWKQGSLYDGTDWPYKNDDGSDNLWPYSPEKYWPKGKEGINHKFFLYHPFSGDGIEAKSPSFNNFEGVEWNQVPQFSPDDYLISDRIMEYASKKSGNTVQKATMKHLMARLRFCFKLGENFSELRMIRIKKLEIVSSSGNQYKINVIYSRKTEGDASVLRPSVEWKKGDMEDYSVTLSNEPSVTTGAPAPYIELSRDNNSYQGVASVYVCPDADISGIKIKATYDVYDYYPESGAVPCLLRENEVSQNTVTLQFLSSLSSSSSGIKLSSGYYYDVNIKIEPNFLYVLSDADLDADGYLIILDN